jgi:glycosyltransferase involved in cell wall biosynthesis
LILTIGIPVYNGEETIAECLRSVLENNIPPYITKLKIIVINDGSTDNTATIVKKFAEKYSCIEYVEYEYNKGKYYALNQLFRLAEGNLLLLDADVILYKNSIKNLTFPYLTDKSVSLTCGLVEIKYHTKKPTFSERVYHFSKSLINEISFQTVTYLAASQVLCLPPRIYKILHVPKIFRLDAYLFLQCIDKGRIIVSRNVVGYKYAPLHLKKALVKSLRVTSVPGELKNFSSYLTWYALITKPILIASTFIKVFAKEPANGICWMLYSLLVRFYKIAFLLKGSKVNSLARWGPIENST